MIKKFLLLSLVIISIVSLRADSQCYDKDWRLRPQAEEPVKCNCNCQAHKQTDDYHCTRCGHKRIPTTIITQESKK